MESAGTYLRAIAKAAAKLESLNDEHETLKANIKLAKLEFEDAVRAGQTYSTGQLSFELGAAE